MTTLINEEDLLMSFESDIRPRGWAPANEGTGSA
jgi:hypothetical protein